MRWERSGDQLRIEVESEAETERVGRALAEVLAAGSIIGLIGPLGAGKTRLVRALAEALGVPEGSVASPTFVLIHEYEGRLPVYHFDTYRLADSEEFEALGVLEYLSGEGVCLIEWADRVADRLPGEAWALRIEPTDAAGRRILLDAPGSAEALERLVAALGRF